MSLRLIGIALAFMVLTLLANVSWLLVQGASGKVLPSVLSAMLASPHLIADTARFVGTMAGLHVAIGFVWSLLLAPFRFRAGIVVLSFLPVLLWILTTNSRWYPQSILAFSTSGWATMFAELVWLCLTAYCAVVVSISIVIWARHNGMALAAAAIVAAGLAFSLYPGMPEMSARQAERQGPDVILIGVDGLRADHVGPASAGDPTLTPGIDRLLSQGTTFSDNWTPLGRTFPAWLSVLTGVHPPSHGGRYNLIGRDRVLPVPGLQHSLGDAGYQRVYAIDETRFSNLDESFGFDVRISPAIGAFDFVAGLFADQPLANLFVNGPAGEHLFPFIYMNRAQATTYRPETFDRALARGLVALDPAKPLFLVAHFELPHWPYTWADSGAFTLDTPERAGRSTPLAYRRSVARADAQVSRLLAQLMALGRLDDAIVIVLSDHGEAFQLEGPTLTAAVPGRPSISLSPGHGTHVLSEPQHRTLLGIRVFGDRFGESHAGRVNGITTSLVDIRPTVESALGIRTADASRPEGMSLWSFVSGTGTTQVAGRVVTIESGFSPAGLLHGAPDPVAIAEQSARFYRVNEIGRLELDDRWIESIDRTKQYGAVTGRWAIGQLPDDPGSGRRTILADLHALDYWDISAGDEPPENAPVAALISALCERYVSSPAFDADLCPAGY